MPWPFVKDSMPNASRGGGNLNVNSGGGVITAKKLPYDPPKGPKGQMHEGPGLGGTNHGKCGTQHGK